MHRTTRWQLALDPAATALFTGGTPIILALWHERLPPMVCQWTRFPDRATAPRLKLHFVISGHRDGRLVAAIAQRRGVASVVGSSSRGGAAALAQMLALLEGGQACVGITPDGPRGPRRVAQQGVAALAALSGRPVVCAAAATRRHRRLKSWDRMMLSLPFGTGALVVGAPIAVARRGDQEAALAGIEAALNAACAQADTMLGLLPE